MPFTYPMDVNQHLLSKDVPSNAFLSAFKEFKFGGTAETLALITIFFVVMSALPPMNHWLALLEDTRLQWSIPYGLANRIIPGLRWTDQVILIKSVILVLVIKCSLLMSAGVATLFIFKRVLQPYRQHFILRSTCQVESSDPPSPNSNPLDPGLLLGYTTDTGEPVYIADDVLNRHIFLEGQTGVGKTVFLRNLMAAQIHRGGDEEGNKAGILMIDGKLDVDNIQDLYELACHAGRKDDFLVINPGQPELSNSYNPILYGAADEISSRIMALVPSTANSAGADHYKQSGEMAIATFIEALKAANLDFNFLSLAMLTMNESALEDLVKRIHHQAPDSMARKNLMMFLDQYSKENIIDGEPNNLHIDLKRLKEMLGGIGSRMHRFGTGDFGKVLNTFTPEVVLYDAIKQGKIVYLALPMMGKDVAAQNLGKITLADLQTAGSWLQLNKEDRPKIPFIICMDEVASFASEGLAIMSEQFRSSNLALVFSLQTDAGLEKISPEFNERIKSNCETKVFYRLSSPETVEIAANMIGMTRRIISSETTGESQSSSSQYLQVGPGKNAADGSTNQIAEREQEEYFVHPDKLKGLDQGECIVLHGRSVWNLRVPLLSLSSQIKEEIGPVQINHKKPRKPIPQGRLVANTNFDPMSQIDKFLAQSRAKRILKRKKPKGEVHHENPEG
jgi:intracellular multiplication protein IcmO